MRYIDSKIRTRKNFATQIYIRGPQGTIPLFPRSPEHAVQSLLIEAASVRQITITFFSDSLVAKELASLLGRLRDLTLRSKKHISKPFFPVAIRV